MSMISYAQNFEDVVLERAFKDKRDGFYIDVGAGGPISDSVTCHFYEKGWHGINIDPEPQQFALLVRYRPRDINLNVALGEREETRTLHLGGELSTLDLDTAQVHASARLMSGEREIRVNTLAQICDQYCGETEIDFLKIDVESWELQVINGGNWERYRPRIVVVEATAPNSRRPAWDRWEPVLLAHKYRFAYFDGLNRFFVREEDLGLLEHFALPLNFFDDFVRYETVALRKQLEAQLEALREQLEAVYQSRSWRYTRGLRAIARGLRRVMRDHANLMAQSSIEDLG